MKPIDALSTLVAAIAGAILLYGIAMLIFSDESNETPALWLAAGAVIGAGVQTAVRVTGVS